ncbi:MAG TPA: hypothetical protein VGM03_08245 [Phycisphaerae bacterium]
MGAHRSKPWILLLVLAGCNQTVAPRGPQFNLPLTIEGRSAGNALVDTGAEGELILADSYGLPVVGSVPIILFSGAMEAGLTAPFTYTVAGVQLRTSGAIVRDSNCACDALGTGFFRRAGTCVRLDYRDGSAALVDRIPDGGIEVPLAPSLNNSGPFTSAHIPVQINELTFADAILDTGANVTAVRALLMPPGSADTYLRLSHYVLGALSVPQARVLTYETEGLPDVIIGTDLMRAWGSVWYFSFSESGGRAATFRTSPTASDSALSGQNAGALLQPGMPN